MAPGQVIPHKLRLGQIMLLGTLYPLAIGLYDAFVTRRHEREAEETRTSVTHVVARPFGDVVFPSSTLQSMTGMP
jgi:hypothetical protein